MKPVNGLPPPNGWTLQTKESMGRTIPTTSDFK